MDGHLRSEAHPKARGLLLNDPGGGRRVYPRGFTLVVDEANQRSLNNR